MTSLESGALPQKEPSPRDRIKDIMYEHVGVITRFVLIEHPTKAERDELRAKHLELVDRLCAVSSPSHDDERTNG